MGPWPVSSNSNRGHQQQRRVRGRNAPAPVGKLISLFLVVATTADCILQTQTTAATTISRHCPSPAACCPLPIARCLLPTHTNPNNNNTHHADHLSPMACGPSPLTATEAINNTNNGFGGIVPPEPEGLFISLFLVVRTTAGYLVLCISCS